MLIHADVCMHRRSRTSESTCSIHVCAQNRAGAISDACTQRMCGEVQSDGRVFAQGVPVRARGVPRAMWGGKRTDRRLGAVYVVPHPNVSTHQQLDIPLHIRCLYQYIFEPALFGDQDGRKGVEDACVSAAVAPFLRCPSHLNFEGCGVGLLFWACRKTVHTPRHCSAGRSEPLQRRRAYPVANCIKCVRAFVPTLQGHASMKAN